MRAINFLSVGVSLFLCTALVIPGWAQQAPPPARTGADAVSPAGPHADQVPTKDRPVPQPQELRKEVVKVNYIDAPEAMQILSSYKSARGRIQMQRNRNTIIIEDTPEFVDKLLSILKEIDVRPLDLMFTVDVIMGAKDEPEAGDPVPGSDPLIRELKNLLNYQHFTRLDSTLVKVQDNGRSSQRLGGLGIGLLLQLYPRHVKDGNKDGFQVELRLLQTTKRMSRQDDQGKVEYFAVPLEKTLSLLESSLSLKDGERSVVGVSKLNGGDTALILIIEGRVVR